MLTAIITDLRDEARLEATLAALAPAAIDGFVRQLLVIVEGADAAALALAEDAGADAVDGFAGACAQARHPWLLILVCSADGRGAGWSTRGPGWAAGSGAGAVGFAGDV